LNLDPEQIRLTSENQTLQQCLHQMEQIITALRQQYMPTPAPAPVPTPLYYGGYAAPPPTPNAPYGGPLAHTNDFPTLPGMKEWRMKQELKTHQVALFDGKLDLEGLLKWQRSIEHYAQLADMNQMSLISMAWQNFTPDVLEWFTHLLQTQYHVDCFLLQYYPFSWAELKSTMEATYASAFATKHVWRNLETLKLGSNLSEFHSQFLDLAKLVGETAYTAVFGSRLYDIYSVKISDLECQILSSVIVTAHQMGRTIHL
jgi:hypothetical protein